MSERPDGVRDVVVWAADDWLAAGAGAGAAADGLGGCGAASELGVCGAAAASFSLAAAVRLRL